MTICPFRAKTRETGPRNGCWVPRLSSSRNIASMLRKPACLSLQHSLISVAIRNGCSQLKNLPFVFQSCMAETRCHALSSVRRVSWSSGMRLISAIYSKVLRYPERSFWKYMWRSYLHSQHKKIGTQHNLFTRCPCDQIEAMQ